MRMVRIATLALCAACALGASGCNTVEGLGRDVQAGGEAISDTAEKTKEAISN